MPPQMMAMRKHYGELNYSEGGTPDYFGDYESALRAGAQRFNVGAVYSVPRVTRGGVFAGDNGILPTWGMAQRWHWMGVFNAAYNPSGLPNQTVLSQWGATPTRWDGDAPLALQSSNTRTAPWLRSPALGNARRIFDSGVNLSGTAAGQ
jgi:hypothetical protein